MPALARVTVASLRTTVTCGILADFICFDHGGAREQFDSGIDEAVADHAEGGIFTDAHDYARRQQDLGAALGSVRRTVLSLMSGN